MPVEQTAYDTVQVLGQTRLRKTVTTRLSSTQNKIVYYINDVMERLESKTEDNPANPPTVSFTYASSGQRKSMLDPSSTVDGITQATSYFYDSRNRLVRKETLQGFLLYHYNQDGGVESISSQNPDGTARAGASVTYGWNALNQLATVTDNRLAAGAQTTQYQYDLNGNLDNYTYPNTVKSVHVYDELNRLKSITTTKGVQTPPLASYAYTIGSAGNRTKVVEQSGRAVNYGYDYRFRLKSEAIVRDIAALNGTVNYGYDQVGNRSTRAVASGGGATLVAKLDGFSHTYNAKDQPDGSTFTDNGNTKYEPLASASIPPSSSNPDQYDFENRLINRANGQLVIVYDGDANRVRKTVGATTTYYLVDDHNPSGYTQVLEELSAQIGTPTIIYTYGHALLSQKNASTTYFYGRDGGNSIRFLTDINGNLVSGHSYSFDAYGVVISPSSAPADNIYLYAGEQLDPHLGLYYNGARYLNQNDGRFWTMDSFNGRSSDPLSLHKYLYCHANPVNRIDPSGLADYLLFWGDEQGAPFEDAAETKRDEIEKRPSYDAAKDKTYIISVVKFDEVGKALNEHREIKEIYFFVHHSPDVMHLDMVSTAPDTNVSKDGRTYKIRGSFFRLCSRICG